MKTKYIKVMADFCADGLWDDKGSMIELPCEELNLPDNILQRVESWQAWYTRDCQDFFEESRRTKTFDREAFSIETFKVAFLYYIGLFEILVIVFNIVPYIALVIIV